MIDYTGTGRKEEKETYEEYLARFNLRNTQPLTKDQFNYNQSLGLPAKIETKVKLLALIGPKGSGKTTLANQLISKSGWRVTSFATPIKSMIGNLLSFQNISPIEVAKMLNGDLKETPTPYLNYKSPRHAMQTLGKEWRELIDKNLWLDIWTRNYSNKEKIIVDDMRFPHEAERIKSLSGKIILISRLSSHTFDPHISEQEYKKIVPDFTIYNDASPSAMLVQLTRYLNGEGK